MVDRWSRYASVDSRMRSLLELNRCVGSDSLCVENKRMRVNVWPNVRLDATVALVGLWRDGSFVLTEADFEPSARAAEMLVRWFPFLGVRVNDESLLTASASFESSCFERGALG